MVQNCDRSPPEEGSSDTKGWKRERKEFVNVGQDVKSFPVQVSRLLLYQKALLSMFVDRYSFPDGLSPTTSSSFRCMSSEIYLCELITQRRSAAALPSPKLAVRRFLPNSCPTQRRGNAQ